MDLADFRGDVGGMMIGYLMETVEGIDHVLRGGDPCEGGYVV